MNSYDFFVHHILITILMQNTWYSNYFSLGSSAWFHLSFCHFCSPFFAHWLVAFAVVIDDVKRILDNEMTAQWQLQNVLLPILQNEGAIWLLYNGFVSLFCALYIFIKILEAFCNHFIFIVFKNHKIIALQIFLRTKFTARTNEAALFCQI